MIPFRRNLPVILSLLILAGAGFFRTVNADGLVYCTNCGTEVTQLASKLQQAQQVATAIKQLQNQINQYANMVTNTTGVSTQIWGNTMQDINQISTLMQKSQALAATASNLDTQFSNRYGTYQSYMTKTMNGADWSQKYSQWSQEASANSLYTLKALGIQAQQLSTEDATIQQLEALAGSAQGRMQALQVANMLAAQSVRQAQKLRQLVMLQLQMQSNYLATQQDKEAAQTAASDQFHVKNFVPLKQGKGF